MAAALTSPAARMLSHRMAAGPFINLPVTDTTAATLDNLEAEPAWMRLIHFNSRPAPYTISRAAVALSARVHDGIMPVDATGAPDPEAWHEVSYNAQGADLPLGPAGGADFFSLTVPPHYGPPGQPGQAFSDWIALPPRRRTDGGKGALLLGRIYVAGPQPFIWSGAPDPAIGRSYAATLTGGDGAAPPWLIGWRNPSFSAGYAIQYISRIPGVTIIAIGDSIAASARTSGHISGHAYRASVLLSRPNQPVAFFNEAVSGRGSVDFIANGRRQIALLRLQFGILQCWSANDPATQAAAEAALCRSVELAAWARDRGCVLVLCTAAPVYGKHPANYEMHRVWNNDQVRQAAARLGLPLLDLDRIWGNGGMPNSYRATFDSGDHMHPNDAGAAAAAVVLAGLLRPLLPMPPT
jgi:lysophospholipase L1-like esterase